MDNLSAGPKYETLYVIPFGAGRGRWNFTFAIQSEGASISNGVSRGGDAGPVPTMYFKYGANDQRRDVTCVNYKWNKDNTIQPAGISKWYFGKYRWDWMTRNPYKGGNDDGAKPVVLRYADILLMAAEIAKTYGIRVYTIGVGREGEAPYPVMTPWGPDVQNMKVEIDEPLLKQIAAETGGKYFRADDNTKLAEIYSEIGRMEKTRTTVDSFPVYKDLFPKYAVWALVCLLLEVLIRALLRRLP